MDFMKWRRRESNPLLLVASEALCLQSFIPEQRCGRVDSNHHSRRRRGYSPLSSPVLSVRETEGGRPGSNRYREDHDLECCLYTTATTSGDDRSRTGDLSPDKRVLWPLSYAPMSCSKHGAGGIRTHGLELMRLARTATPLSR